MKLRRELTSVVIVFVMLGGFISCSKKQEEAATTDAVISQENPVERKAADTIEAQKDLPKVTANITEEGSEESDDKNWDEVYTVTDYTPDPKRLEKLNFSSELDKYDLTVEASTGEYDRNFQVSQEAENAKMTGKVKAESEVQGYSGTGYINGLEGEGDTVTFQVTVPGDGSYELDFVTCGAYGQKENTVSVDDVPIGTTVVEEGKTFVDCILSGVYLTTGEHEIEVSKSWGWVLIDRLIVTASPQKGAKTSALTADLIDPYATKRTKMLMQFLVDINSKYILSGQYGDAGLSSAEFGVIKEATGRVPAILGLDLIEYSPSRAAHGSKSQVYERARAFDKEGGIITLCWHWNAPQAYLYDTKSIPWWKGIYTEGTNIDLAKIMNGEDEAGYDALMQDIDVIAFHLNRLQELDIPILWRPIHEASGTWFWWGAAGAEAYKKLWIAMYEKLTYEHGIHNLIWVWNGQDPEWYPGDEYVDIIGEDIYPGKQIYSSQSSTYREAEACTTASKIITLSENGCLVDPDLAFRDDAVWSWFCTWNSEFVLKGGALSEEYTDAEMFDKVYNHKKVITLDELPDLKKYGESSVCLGGKE